jgi:hypothetical protein
MKINEVIQEGVWDNLKTAGQTIKQGAGTIGQGVKQGAGAVANYAKQNYQQTRQAQQQRFGQAAAQQFPQPKKWLGKDWSPQAQLRAKNIGSFAGDVASTIAKAGGGVGGGSLYTAGTSTIPKNTVAVGTELQTKVGKFTMTDKGWIDDTNKPVTDPNMVTRLNSAAIQNQTGPDVDPTKPEDPTAIPTVTSPSGILGPGGKPIQYDAQGKPIVS